MRILVVEDALDILEILTVALGHEGWEVATAANLAAAESQLNQSLDLILLDYQLPDGDGVTAAQRWKSDPATASIPIALYTGADTNPPVGLFADVIVKTVDPFQLSERLRQLLE